MKRTLTSKPATRTTDRRGNRVIPLMAALALAAAAGSCERENKTQKAIDSANLKLESLSVAGANPVYAKDAKAAFNDVAGSLKPIADGQDPSAAAAQVLVARAKSGLGEIAAKDASDLERTFLSRVTVASALLDQWNSQHATAAALARYDPSKDLAELDKSITEKQALAAKLQSDKAAQEAVVGQIQARAEKARGAAKKEREREASIRKQAEGVTQTEREQFIQKAVEAARSADAQDRQAAELTAEAAKESPKVAEIVGRVQEAQEQADSLRKAKANIQQRAAAAKQQSADAEKEANIVGKSINDELDKLKAIREASQSPTREALTQYQQAASVAKKAIATPAKETKLQAATASGTYQQAIGDIQANRARSLAIYGSVLEAMSKAEPALPAATEVSKRLADVKTELEASRKDAETAYEEAKNAYDKVKGAGDVQKKVDAVVAALAALDAERKKPLEAPKPAAPAPEAKPAEAMPEAAGDKAPTEGVTEAQQKEVETAARALLKDLADAATAGDLEKFRSLVDLNADAAKQAFDATMPLAINAKKFNDACKAKFGKDFEALLSETQVPSVKSNPIFMMAGPMLGGAGKAIEVLTADNVAKATIKVVSATKADAEIPGDDSTTHVVKVGDAWKVSIAEELGGAAAQLGPMAGMFKKVVGVMDEVANNTNAGKYPKADDMLIDLSAKLSGAMSDMPGMGGGGGGGGGGKGPGGRRPPGGGG